MMTNRGRRALRAAATYVLVVLASLIGDARADDQGQVLALKARGLISTGRCPEALPILERARMELPGDAELALLHGECQIREKDYQSAASTLREARRLDPQLTDVELYLGVALYHLEDFAGAELALAAARGNVSDYSESQFELYNGLMALRRGEAREAALALERARMINSAQVEPVASYYAALAWQSINERKLAREALLRVIEIDEGGAWARRAELALLGREHEERSWGSLSVGLEYDSNVVLRGEQAGTADPVTLVAEDDGRGQWFLEGGIELFLGERFSGGVLASYSGSAHFDTSELDIHYPTGSLWLDFDIDNRTILRGRYDAGFAWVDYDPFVTNQGINISLFRNWGEAGNSELYAAWNWNQFHFDIATEPMNTVQTVAGQPCVLSNPDPDNPPCSPFGLDTRSSRDRDGNGLKLGLEHRRDIRAVESEWLRNPIVRGGYEFESYWAEGDDYGYLGHLFSLGLEGELPWKVTFDLSASFVYRPFDNPSSFPDPARVTKGLQYPLKSSRRSDRVWYVAAAFERPINRFLDVAVRYQFIDNYSNVVVFDYDRHVVGGYLILRY